MGAIVACTSGSSVLATKTANAETGVTHQAVISPGDVKINLRPVMTNIIHTGVWEGPCRFRVTTPAKEKVNAGESFAKWSRDIKKGKLRLNQEDVNILEPVHITFSENFVLKQRELDKLKSDARKTDAYFIYPGGSSITAFEIGKRFNKPIILRGGLDCRNVDIAAYSKNKGQEVFVPANSDELIRLVSLLRARKVFARTKVLFPTDSGLPAVCSVGSISDLKGLEEKLGIAVERISYKELTEEMNSTIKSKLETEKAEQLADELLRSANKSYLDRKYVVKSMQFYRTVKNLMNRYGCNAFTIECFELCSSKLADKWTITPCLIHSLLRNEDYASSCEGDLGSLLAMRMLMSVSGKSPHQGNTDPRPKDTFRINHSVPSMKMNGYDKPDVPYQLGRFTESGWGTKVVVDFMNNRERKVTVARIDPSATKLLVLSGKLVGASGWDSDKLGCSVEALIKPPNGRADEFLKKRLDYGNHLQWVYGDYTEQMQQLGEMLNLQVEVIS